MDQIKHTANESTYFLWKLCISANSWGSPKELMNPECRNPVMLSPTSRMNFESGIVETITDEKTGETKLEHYDLQNNMIVGALYANHFADFGIPITDLDSISTLIISHKIGFTALAQLDITKTCLNSNNEPLWKNYMIAQSKKQDKSGKESSRWTTITTEKEAERYRMIAESGVHSQKDGTISIKNFLMIKHHMVDYLRCSGLWLPLEIVSQYYDTKTTALILQVILIRPGSKQ